MNETITRSLSGAIYISIFLCAIFFSENGYLFATLMLVFAAITCWEFNKIIKVNNIRSYFQLGIVAYFTYLSISQTEKSEILYLFLAFTTLTFHILLTRNLFKLKKINDNSILKQQLPLLYIILPFCLITHIPSIIDNKYNPYIIFGILLIIWSNDTFAYIFGKNFGKRKLFEKISPKKTIEGFLGGLFSGVFVSILLSIYTSTLNTAHWIILSIIISIFGSIGDLVASKFKREGNIKDSSNLIPGHGGFLDRLDSLIFISSIVYLYLQLINYVS